MTQKPDLKCVGGTSLKGEVAARIGSHASGLMLPVFDKLKTSVSRHLSKMMAEFFDSIDDAFFDLAERASFSREQEQYFDTMRSLRLQRNAMIAHFVLRWEDGFNTVFRSKSDANGLSLTSGELSLMQHDELEENVAIDAIVKKSRDAVAHGTYALNARMAAAMRTVTLTQESNPIDARAICEAFRGACGLIDVEIRHKLILFKLFEKQFLTSYPSLIRDGNLIFIEAGVLPELKGMPAEKDGGSGSTGTNDTKDSSATSEEARTGFAANLQALIQAVRATSGNWQAGGQPESLANLGSLASAIAEKGYFGGAIGSPSPVAKAVATQQLVSLLSNLQSAQPLGHAYSFGEVMPEVNLRSSLSSLMDQQQATLGPVRVQESDTNIIDLVAMLFEYILSDNNLPERIKALIGRLQIPTLKVAIMDPALFSRSSHPARRLINEMARAGLGLSQSPEIIKDAVFLKIQDIVQTLLKEFKDDVTIFEKKLREFSTFMEQEVRRSSILEQRTRAVEEGRARSDEATEEASAAIVAHTGEKLLPRVVVSILENVWQQYLYLVFLKQGADSLAWKLALETIDDLVESVTPVDSDEQRERLFTKRDGLERALKLVFKTVSYNPFEMNQLLAELTELQQDVLRKEPLNEVVESEPTDQLMEALSRDLDSIFTGQNSTGSDIIKVESNLAKVTPLKVAQKAEEESGVQLPALAENDTEWLRAKSMQVGCWMEYLDAEGTKLRCKLAAFIRSVDKMIFVNRSGVKLFEKKILEFAHDLKNKKAVPLDDSLLFDRALESVIGNLKKIRQQKL